MMAALSAFNAIRQLAARVPWQAYAILALLAVWYVDRTRHGNERAYEARAEMQAKIDAADKARADALASEEQALRELAKRTDRNVEQARNDNRDRTERFIANGGVRQACPDNRNPARGSAGRGEAVHQAPVMDGAERLPEVVTVLPDDVRVCTDTTLVAEALREFVLGLESE